MDIAALDLGSNTFHLLVARVTGDGQIQKLDSKKVAIRLGDTVAEHGIIPPEPFAQALGALGEMAETAQQHRVDRFAAVGTSAIRDARNGSTLVAKARARYGVDVEILSGDEEGRLAYRGARARLPELPERAVVLDLGGSSLEIAAGDTAGCHWVESLPLGFLRLARTLGVTATLDTEGAASLRSHVRSVVQGSSGRLRAFGPEAWVLSGGTARALGALAEAEQLSSGKLRHLAEQVGSLEPGPLQKLGVEATRAATLGLGVAIFADVVELLEIPQVVISPGGLREGIVLRELCAARANAEPRAWAKAV